ncbi:ABC transporter ATP-binding protein [candidate division KSB3 bacterium]|uniref:ABC transporter ATP-binding protein n=1 Tax=candidate division KSB3 bacterium TaxID=2044937 RepID=A0A2G6ECV1_9BACT|nr:MAG: ABC transporter ATP-binding protein [candidate division KSB3 bacterium]
MRFKPRLEADVLLQTYDAVFGYANTPIIPATQIQIKKGECIGLVGSNGSGKTTLVRGLLGLLAPLSGQVVRGRDLSIGYLAQRNPQSDSLFPATVREVVECGIHGHALWDRKHPKHKHADALVDRVMDILKITHLGTQRIGELSGGQHQRVLLARALVMNPELLVLDEPTSALDAGIRAEFYELLKDLHKRGVAVLMISHDITHLEGVIDRVIYVDKGVAFDGSAADFFVSSHLHSYQGGAGDSCAADEGIGADEGMPTDAGNATSEEERS